MDSQEMTDWYNSFWTSVFDIISRYTDLEISNVLNLMAEIRPEWLETDLTGTLVFKQECGLQIMIMIRSIARFSSSYKMRYLDVYTAYKQWDACKDLSDNHSFTLANGVCVETNNSLGCYNLPHLLV